MRVSAWDAAMFVSVLSERVHDLDLCLPRQSCMPARYAHPLHSFAWNQKMRGISSCLFYPPSSSSSSSWSADVVGPLRAHLLCCRSFGPASVWLGARWLGCHPKQSTQVSRGSTALTSPIKGRQETDVRPNTSCKAPSQAKTRRGFTWIYTSWWRENPWGEVSLLVSLQAQKTMPFPAFASKEDVLTWLMWENNGEEPKPPQPTGK